VRRRGFPGARHASPRGKTHTAWTTAQGRRRQSHRPDPKFPAPASGRGRQPGPTDRPGACDAEVASAPTGPPPSPTSYPSRAPAPTSRPCPPRRPPAPGADVPATTPRPTSRNAPDVGVRPTSRPPASRTTPVPHPARRPTDETSVTPPADVAPADDGRAGTAGPTGKGTREPWAPCPRLGGQPRFGPGRSRGDRHGPRRRRGRRGPRAWTPGARRRAGLGERRRACGTGPGRAGR
jgi:hypothetical protein